VRREGDSIVVALDDVPPEPMEAPQRRPQVAGRPPLGCVDPERPSNFEPARRPVCEREVREDPLDAVRNVQPIAFDLQPEFTGQQDRDRLRCRPRTENRPTERHHLTHGLPRRRHGHARRTASPLRLRYVNECVVPAPVGRGATAIALSQGTPWYRAPWHPAQVRHAMARWAARRMPFSRSTGSRGAQTLCSKWKKPVGSTSCLSSSRPATASPQ
jgi:hypothetical protein